MLMLDPDPKAFRCKSGYQLPQCQMYCRCGGRGSPQQSSQQQAMVVGLMPEIQSGGQQAMRLSTGADGLKQLAKQLSTMSEEIEKLAAVRDEASSDRPKTKKMLNELKADAESLAPMLRSHVLLVGLAKGQHLNISQGCANVGVLQTHFDYAAVEGAHRQVEDARDHIQQEITFRKLNGKLKQRSSETSCPVESGKKRQKK
eukprot:6099141-Prymnesium_polylepis.1